MLEESRVSGPFFRQMKTLSMPTGEMICSKYKEMLEGWGIQREQIHLIIRDNASNMVKAMREVAYPDCCCIHPVNYMKLHHKSIWPFFHINSKQTRKIRVAQLSQ